jgi:uncharacterized protein (TIGR02246 family)
MHTHDEICALFRAWNAALQTGDADEVVALYAPDAVLLPTFSNAVRTTDDERRDYFARFLRRRPSATLEEAHARAFGEVAILSGVYAFTFAAGPLHEARARFTFAYRRIAGQWRIVEHHSSAMPEQATDHPPKSGPYPITGTR